MEPPLDLTAVVCTWNRAASLVRLLESFERLRTPPGLRWEAIVVDNNSTDGADAAAARFASRLPLRVLHEPKQGKSHALNLAVREARGRWLFFADDDQAAHPDWFAAHLEGIRRFPDFDFFAGPIEPELEEPPQPWMRKAWRGLRSVYGYVDHGPRLFELGPETCACGGNFVVRTEVQRRFPYDPRMGRNGAALAAGEETLVQLQMFDAGRRGAWNPGAPMRHFIPASRTRLPYLLKMYHARGAASEWVERRNPADRSLPALRQRRRKLRRLLAAYWLRACMHVVDRDVVRWARYRFLAEEVRGRLDVARAGMAADPLALAAQRPAA